MDLDPAEAPQQSAVSEPRQRPSDELERPLKKRQRINSGPKELLTSSEEVSSSNATSPRNPTPESDMELNSNIEPQTPPRQTQGTPSTPVSSKVTINLRATRMPNEASDTAASITANANHQSLRGGAASSAALPPTSESASLSSTPSSATVGSPKIELVVEDEDIDVGYPDSPPVAIINDGDEVLMDRDFVSSFPYGNGDVPAVAVQNVSRLLEFDDLKTYDPFLQLNQWMKLFLAHTEHSNRAVLDSYARYYDFWHTLPEILVGLNKRRIFFGDWLKKSFPGRTTGRNAVTEFFSLFAELTARFGRVACQIFMRHGSSEDGDMLLQTVKSYMSQLQNLVDAPGGTIGDNLQRHYQFHWYNESKFILQRFIGAGGTVDMMSELAKAYLKPVTTEPKAMENVIDLCRLNRRIISDILDASRIVERSGIHEDISPTLQQGYQFYRNVAPALEMVIEKHVGALSVDVAGSILADLSDTLTMTLVCDTPGTATTVQRFSKLYPDVLRKDLGRVVGLEWKFDMLKKLITCSQMQLRVLGVTTMCSDLLSLFTEYKSTIDSVSMSPTLTVFSDFIVENKLIDYIVGIGSHPELILHSSNIVGFLAATKSYTRHITDIIWQTIGTSSDLRTVDAIARMLHQITNLLDYNSLLYFCEKMRTLPLTALTSSMKALCANVLKYIKMRAFSDGILLPATPYLLCLNIVQLASITSPEAPLGSTNTYIWAVERLRDLPYNEKQAELWRDLYKSLLDDISANTETSLGSIAALNVLLNITDCAHLHTLTADYRLAAIMIEHLERSKADGSVHAADTNAYNPIKDQRSQIILAIIQYEPSSLEPPLGERLWNALVGEVTSSQEERETGWNILNQAAARNGESNSFIMTCRQELLPVLNPCYFQTGACQFLRNALKRWLQDAPDDVLESTDIRKLGLVELLWKMLFESPADAVAHDAAVMLIDLYVENPLIRSMSSLRARNVHLRFVQRCLQKLSNVAEKINAASRSSETQQTLSLGSLELSKDGMAFIRCLRLLREFLETYKTRPLFYIPNTTRPLGTTVAAGPPFTIRYQIIDGESHGEQRELEFGSENTLADLFAFIKEKVGLDHFKLYHGGSTLVPDLLGGWRCKLEDTRLGAGLLIVRKEGVGASSDEPPVPPTLEKEIMNHAKELWSYLDMEDEFAIEIIRFLDTLPIYPDLLKAFQDDSVHWSGIFPLGKPHKCSYALTAIHRYMQEVGMPSGEHEAQRQRRWLSLLFDGLANRELLESIPAGRRRERLTHLFLGHLDELLKQPHLSEVISELAKPELILRFMGLAVEASTNPTTQDTDRLVLFLFRAALNISVRSQQTWKSFSSCSALPDLVGYLLLDRFSEVRSATFEQLKGSLYHRPTTAVPAVERAGVFWSILASWIDEAAQAPERCGEFFEIAYELFRSLSDACILEADLNTYFLSWGTLLVRQKPAESIAHDRSLLVKAGLGRLLCACVKAHSLRGCKVPNNVFARDLLQTHLYPPLSIDNGDDYITEHIPTVDAAIRSILNDVVFALAKEDTRQRAHVIRYVAALPPQDAPKINRACDVVYGHDNSKALRSPAGYVGLRNLSNTCYLNSLVTQLFMNVSFRGFMMNLSLGGAGDGQQLLTETQKLFAYMQNSFRRYADPFEFSTQIITYEDTNIDVTVQMDVDEFYNLLFDRMESQMSSSADKKEFRSFYGGQIVQQMKSKECPHISERLEPFSAIQCEIKGKNSLEESLQAYVDGEVMEGDNKYKCSKCDKHVDAVKRACLKDIPDNLIFHLKRFEFNLRTMQRSKINDFFTFPDNIDMRPYTVEHLSDPSANLPSDPFELVGVLVHSGTAETGHYYSYIRERPSSSEVQKWLEFNDDTVSIFDPSLIESACFGGADYRSSTSGYPSEKCWNAYMLFYQRSSAVQAQRQDMLLSQSLMAPKLRVPLPVSNAIAKENEVLLRKFFLNEDTHLNFVLSLVRTDGHNFVDHEEDNTGRYDAALYALLGHLDQVLSKVKDIATQLKFFVKILEPRLESCITCAKACMSWLIDHPDTMRTFYLKSPEPIFRDSMVDITMQALRKLKRHDLSRRGSSTASDASSGIDDEAYADSLLHLIDTLDYVHEVFHTSLRAWPEYFTLLNAIAKLGSFESKVLIDEGWLLKVLEILTAHHVLKPSKQLLHMLQMIAKRNLSRPVEMSMVTQLLSRLLKHCDLSAECIEISSSRSPSNSSRVTVPLNYAEYRLMTAHLIKTDANIFTHQILNIHSQDVRILNNIFRKMLTELGSAHEHRIANAIRLCHQENLDDQNETVMKACMFTAWTFYEFARNPDLVADLIIFMADRVEEHRQRTANIAMEYLVLYPKHIMKNENLEAKNRGMDRAIKVIPRWAPCMLMNGDSDVRSRASLYLRSILLENDMGEDIDEDDKESWDIIVHRTVFNTGLCCLRYLWQRIVEPNLQPSRAQYADALSVIEAFKAHYEEVSRSEPPHEYMSYYQRVMPYMMASLNDDQDEEASEEWDEQGSEDGDFSSTVGAEPVLQIVGLPSDQLEDADGEADDIDIDIDTDEPL